MEDIDPVMRDLLEAHQQAFLRELGHLREDNRLHVAQLREDWRKDMERIDERQTAHEERTRKVEQKLGYLGALHTVGAALLLYIAKRVFGE